MNPAETQEKSTFAKPGNDSRSPSVEDYLKHTYSLTQQDEVAKPGELAQRLEVAPASVTGMVRRLAEQGLMQYEPYKGVALTDEGRSAALKTIRRHRLVELLLVQVLGYSWDEVHDEAELLEHSVSDKLADRIAAFLDHPQVDPHGDLIPTANGELPNRVDQPLHEIAAGQTAVIAQVDDDAEFLRYCDALGLRPGVSLLVVEVAPFGGPITLQLQNETVQIGPAAAARVIVESVEGDKES